MCPIRVRRPDLLIDEMQRRRFGTERAVLEDHPKLGGIAARLTYAAPRAKLSSRSRAHRDVDVRQVGRLVGNQDKP